MYPVATPTTQLDRLAVRDRVLQVIRELLLELGSEGALPILGGASQLDRDLGLGSLERVELLARLETAFGVRLPDRVASEANTPEDLASAICGAPETETATEDEP
jgi:acyl carrier protein